MKLILVFLALGGFFDGLAGKKTAKKNVFKKSFKRVASDSYDAWFPKDVEPVDLIVDLPDKFEEAVLSSWPPRDKAKAVLYVTTFPYFLKNATPKQKNQVWDTLSKDLDAMPEIDPGDPVKSFTEYLAHKKKVLDVLQQKEMNKSLSGNLSAVQEQAQTSGELAAALAQPKYQEAIKKWILGELPVGGPTKNGDFLFIVDRLNDKEKARFLKARVENLKLLKGENAILKSINFLKEISTSEYQNSASIFQADYKEGLRVAVAKQISQYVGQFARDIGNEFFPTATTFSLKYDASVDGVNRLNSRLLELSEIVRGLQKIENPSGALTESVKKIEEVMKDAVLKQIELLKGADTLSDSLRRMSNVLAQHGEMLKRRGVDVAKINLAKNIVAKDVDAFVGAEVMDETDSNLSEKISILVKDVLDQHDYRLFAEHIEKRFDDYKDALNQQISLLEKIYKKVAEFGSERGYADNPLLEKWAKDLNDRITLTNGFISQLRDNGIPKPAFDVPFDRIIKLYLVAPYDRVERLRQVYLEFKSKKGFSLNETTLNELLMFYKNPTYNQEFEIVPGGQEMKQLLVFKLEESLARKEGEKEKTLLGTLTPEKAKNLENIFELKAGIYKDVYGLIRPDELIQRWEQEINSLRELASRWTHKALTGVGYVFGSATAATLEMVKVDAAAGGSFSSLRSLMLAMVVGAGEKIVKQAAESYEVKETKQVRADIEHGMQADRTISFSKQPQKLQEKIFRVAKDIKYFFEDFIDSVKASIGKFRFFLKKNGHFLSQEDDIIRLRDKAFDRLLREMNDILPEDKPLRAKDIDPNYLAKRLLLVKNAISKLPTFEERQQKIALLDQRFDEFRAYTADYVSLHIEFTHYLKNLADESLTRTAERINKKNFSEEDSSSEKFYTNSYEDAVATLTGILNRVEGSDKDFPEIRSFKLMFEETGTRTYLKDIMKYLRTDIAGQIKTLNEAYELQQKTLAQRRKEAK